MRYTYTGLNMEVTPGLKAAVEKKIGKLDHFFTPDTEVIVAMSTQKDRQKIEVTIPIKGNTIRAEESSTDMYVSIDLVEEIIERQIRRYRKKLIDRKQAAVSFSQAFIEEEDETPEDEIQIVRTKKFAIKPTNPEEACLQMEMLGHNFYVFLNSDTDQVNVVYKRKNGTYGLIEPEFYLLKILSLIKRPAADMSSAAALLLCTCQTAFPFNSKSNRLAGRPVIGRRVANSCGRRAG